jgi:hypothetical protein
MEEGHCDGFGMLRILPDSIITAVRRYVSGRGEWMSCWVYHLEHSIALVSIALTLVADLLE